MSNPTTAYVQTIKDAKVSPGDPFGNRQTFFYKGLMFSKHASNAVFPCGSGLVWRKEQLGKIGGFPTWNLVEDLYSGYVAMQHGFKNSYLPIVGAIGQVAPEDIPNVYKQLGTWALDTFRVTAQVR
jgi:cellulose synthase (UDP-forming)